MVAGDSPALTWYFFRDMRSSQKSRTPRLAGVRILVGRARHQASALSSGLRDLGAEVLEIPFIEIRKPRSYKALDGALKESFQV